MTPTEQTTPPTPPQFSMEQLRTMMERPDVDLKITPEPKAPETPVVETPMEDKTKKADEGTAPVEVDEPEETEEEKVSPRLKKKLERIARETAEITHAISEKKAAQAELEKLTGKGTEPVKPDMPAIDANAAPTMPDLETFDGSGSEFKAAMAKWNTEYDAWRDARTKQTVSAEFKEQQERDAAKARWDVAVKDHGEVFPAWADKVVAVAPDGLQNAISAMQDWAILTKHLANSPAELKALVDEFKGSPFRAAVSLGKLEARLTAPPKQETKPVDVTPSTPKVPKVPKLPEPLDRIEVAPEGSGAIDWETATMAEKRRYMEKQKLL